MKIGYDAKRLFHNNTGLGNYSRDLVRIMAHFYPKNEYHLYNPKLKKIDTLLNSDSIIEHLPQKKIDKIAPSLWRSKNVVKDLIHNNISIYHGLSAEIPYGIEKTTIKSIVTIHDLIFLRYPEFYKKIDVFLYTKKLQNALLNANLIIAISEQTKEDIITFFGIKASKIKVIYQGCHTIFKQVIPENYKKEVSSKFKLPNKFLLNVGTLETRKNALQIIKSIKGTKIPLVLVGRKTPYFFEIKEFISKNKMENQIIHLENINLKELAVLYQLATIFIYPSLFEGFGIPIIEALYSSTPVITSTNGCFSEAAGPNSIYVNPNDKRELREKIIDLWENESLQSNMKKEGLTFVQKFNDDVLANQWQNTYCELICKS